MQAKPAAKAMRGIASGGARGSEASSVETLRRKRHGVASAASDTSGSRDASSVGRASDTSAASAASAASDASAATTQAAQVAQAATAMQAVWVTCNRHKRIRWRKRLKLRLELPKQIRFSAISPESKHYSIYAS